LSFGIIGVLGMVVLRRTSSAKPGASSFGNLVQREVWSMLGIAISIYAIGALTAIYLGRFGYELVDTIMTVALLLYGVAFAVTGKAAQIGWFRIVSVLAFVLAAISLLLLGTPELYLFGALAVLLVGFLPGLVLMLGEPAPSPDEA
jgi:hypothetical protein